MNLKQLEAFVRVADARSFSAAAKELYLSQPTVSAHVAALERELGCALLNRSTKEVSLTQKGHELYMYAEQMLAVERRIEEHFGLECRRGVLRIAASTVPAQYLLPRALATFRERYPHERIKVIETDSAGAFEHVLEHRADIGFAGTALEGKRCIYQPIYRDELAVVMPATERYRALPERDIASWLPEEPIIMREEGSGTRRETELLLERMGIDPARLTVVATIENEETIKRSVASGVGVSIMSLLAVRSEVAAGALRVCPLGAAGGCRDINLVLDPGYLRTAAAESFIEIVRGLYGHAPRA